MLEKLIKSLKNPNKTTFTLKCKLLALRQETKKCTASLYTHSHVLYNVMNEKQKGI